ncbi:MAG: ACT domain-containing protein [Clostridiales bacterium]|nr:ACT domain-containing protein [Clostridiales bacterium]MBQ3321689.1 ACT domain-containing protein [Bacillota bacterium]
MAITQLSIFLENKPGTLHETVKRISEAGVNIRAMTIAEVRDFGILRIIVSDVEKAMSVLQDDHIITTTEVVSAVMEDKAGALYDILQALEAANVNIEYMYAYTGEVTGSANVVFRVDDIEGAEAKLKEAGVQVL